MYALQKTRPSFGVELRDVPQPRAPGSGEALVAVGAAGLCGTDLHIYEWTPGYEGMTRAMPVTLGHEFAGSIAEVGAGVDGLVPGALVAVRPSVTCGRCEACVAGRDDDCTHRTGLGVTRDGGLASHVVVPATNCVLVPGDLDAEIAALTEPMTVCAEAVATGEVHAGARVLVIGPGNIGQGIALFAREAGAAQVVIAGRDDGLRLQVLRHMGFADTVDTRDAPLSQALAPYLAQGLFDVVFEATGVPQVVAAALSVLRKRGVVVIAGIHPAPVTFDATRLVRAHQQIRGSYRAPPATWPRVIDFLGRHRDVVRRMITHKLPLDRAPEAFELARQRQASKVLVVP
ncbi:MAG TPA: alcohol dehydrogenase catalytic domain-containing protein [Casimicrobiaceae bacterium]|nr:alcohol dehydrogenase catalytic domain-containing protein [Casimicrobiaceae bacterium]